MHSIPKAPLVHFYEYELWTFLGQCANLIIFFFSTSVDLDHCPAAWLHFSQALAVKQTAQVLIPPPLCLTIYIFSFLLFHVTHHWLLITLAANHILNEKSVDLSILKKSCEILGTLREIVQTAPMWLLFCKWEAKIWKYKEKIFALKDSVKWKFLFKASDFTCMYSVAFWAVYIGKWGNDININILLLP